MKGFWIAVMSAIGISIAVSVKPGKESVDKFGEIEIFQPKTDPKLAVFILFDEASWRDEATAIAGSIAADKNLAVVVNLGKYRKQMTGQRLCANIAGDL